MASDQFELSHPVSSAMSVRGVVVAQYFGRKWIELPGAAYTCFFLGGNLKTGFFP